ncbi:MAG: flagellar protein FlaG [Anaerolineae bacterium]
MSTQPDFENCQTHLDSYTYPQFIIVNETTGQIEVNFIDKDSGRVVRHIPSTELKAIVRSYYLLRQEAKAHAVSK